MRILSLIHGDNVRSGVFGEVVTEGGHELEEWSLAWDDPIPRPLDDYDALLVFGGAMHADQDVRHPWLREEDLFLQRVLPLRLPVLGVCLGAQLLAKAALAPVFPASEPEIGWFPVELTDAADEDPVFSRLPRRFDAFQWHYYTHGLPGGAYELARSPVCTQAFRLGECAWGIQFHAEVDLGAIQAWADEGPEELPVSPEEFIGAARARIDEWSEIGRLLCGGFLEAAARVATPA